MEPENPGLELMKSAGEGFGRESSHKIFNAIGGLFPFWGMKKKAVDTYVTEIQQSDLSPEAKMMAIANCKKTFKEFKNQAAIAATAYSVAKEGTDFSETSDVDDEWLSRFMEAGKHVSDEKVQALWGNILAGEFENPGSTPPSIIRILSELTPKYAQAFSHLCSMEIAVLPVNKITHSITVEKMLLIPAESKAPFLKNLDLSFSVLSEMDALGLIHFDTVSEYVNRFDATIYPKLYVVCGNSSFTITKYPNKAFPIGTVILSNVGQCISRFVEKKEIAGYTQAVESFFNQSHGVEVCPGPSITLKEVMTEKGTVCSYQILDRE